jgi:hypothetical protein
VTKVEAVGVFDGNYFRIAPAAFGQELRALKIPFFSLLEGGYSRERPELVLEYLKGVDVR